MLCLVCQQEVPGVRAPYDSALRCARCHTPFPQLNEAGDTSETAGLAGGIEPTAETEKEAANLTASYRAALLCDDWELDESLRTAERLVAALEMPSASGHGQGSAAASHTRVRNARSRVEDTRNSWSVVGTRLLLAAALFAFVLGGSLLAWSLWAERPELWRVGVPLAFAGQVGLALGLISQLECVWRNNQAANEALAGMDEDLAALEQATTALPTGYSRGRPYAVHPAQSASPHILLADVQRRLETLGSKLAEQRRS